MLQATLALVLMFTVAFLRNAAYPRVPKEGHKPGFFSMIVGFSIVIYLYVSAYLVVGLFL